jgi:FkbM family methyltransferase
MLFPTEFCQRLPCALIGADYQIALEFIDCKPSRLYYIGKDQHPPGSKPLRLPSCEAASLIADKSLACVFLAQPNYADMCTWWPKVAMGGSLMGRIRDPVKLLELSWFSGLLERHDVQIDKSLWMITKKFGESIEILPDCDIAIISGDCGASTWAYQLRRLDADEAMLARLTALIPKDTIVIDAGAFIGSHTKAYLQHSPEVWAFEPNPTAYACLCYNCPEAKTFNLALGDQEEHLSLTPIYPNCGGSFLSSSLQPRMQVEVRPLDSFSYSFHRRIGFIKVDVEGMEVRFLRGAKHILKTHKPIMCLEVNTDALKRNNTTPQILLSTLTDLGFNTEPIWPGRDQEYQWDVIATPQ